MKKIILTGDRPTGKLHLGHYVGSLKQRLELQENEEYEQYVFIADLQALTDNARNPEKIRNSLKEVALDYLSIGLDPKKTTMFVQSQIPELSELNMYYLNLVTLSRLKRNPTIKNEINERGFGDAIPVGFLTYPISQAADITAFGADLVPVGDDQLPLIEQCKEIVHTFNSYYGDVLKEPEALLAKNDACKRLPGIDGKNKMSKSLGNCIFLSDDSETVYKKVMSMYTDPNHIKIEDPGNVEDNAVFTYLDAFANDTHFQKYLPEYNNLDELKEHYQKGGLGDVKIKKFLYNILEELLNPIREKRAYYESHLDLVYKILEEGSNKARKTANNTLNEVKKAMGINYFE
ncbi:MAG: tryptophan--tRNA ligase [Ruminococcus sp.]|nr:tryptophan--tRNA ligase [Ruminococcus sp.]